MLFESLRKILFHSPSFKLNNLSKNYIVPPKKVSYKRSPRLVVDFKETFWLIGIQSELEIFELVYHINRLGNSRFKRTNEDILTENQTHGWPLYQWQQFENSKPEYIFSNWFESPQKPNGESPVLLKAFDTPWFKKVYLLTEFNQMDYFIKLYIGDRVKLLMEQINKIKGVFLHLVIPSEQIKNSALLIFD